MAPPFALPAAPLKLTCPLLSFPQVRSALAVLLRSSRQISPTATPAPAVSLPASAFRAAPTIPPTPAHPHLILAPAFQLPSPAHAQSAADELSKCSRAPSPAAPKIFPTLLQSRPDSSS